MSIKIFLPEQKIDESQRETNIKKIFGEDKERKEGLLSQIMVFVYLNKVLSITELTDKLQEYYKREFDRIAVFRGTDRLYKLGLFKRITGGELLSMDEEEKEEIHKYTESKHRKFLSKISPQFRNRYSNINYVWVANGEGHKYLSWCAKLNNFSFEEE